jgi:hypothetical protein
MVPVMRVRYVPIWALPSRTYEKTRRARAREATRERDGFEFPEGD